MSAGAWSQFSPNLQQPMPTIATLSRMAAVFMLGSSAYRRAFLVVGGRAAGLVDLPEGKRTIAVQERVDGLELRVRQPDLDERGERRVVEELLPRAEAFHQPVGRRRYVRRTRDRGPGTANPVLAAPEPARTGGLAARPLHETLVHLPDQAQRERELL